MPLRRRHRRPAREKDQVRRRASLSKRHASHILKQFLVALGTSWKATTYSLPIPVGSWDDWKLDCSVRSADLVDVLAVGSTANKHRKLLRNLVSRSNECHEEEEITKATSLAHPVWSVADDDDIVYMLTKGIGNSMLRAVDAIDVRVGALQGVAKIDASKHKSFNRCYLASGIAGHLKVRPSPSEAGATVQGPELNKVCSMSKTSISP